MHASQCATVVTDTQLKRSMITNKASSNECQIVELSDPAAVMTAVHLTLGTVTNESLELTATNSSYEDQDSIVPIPGHIHQT